MAELIEMSFGLRTRIGPRNYVLDWRPEVLRDVAMATTFWLSMAITSARCLILGGGFSGVKLSDVQRHSRLRGSAGRCHGNQFWD